MGTNCAAADRSKTLLECEDSSVRAAEPSLWFCALPRQPGVLAAKATLDVVNDPDCALLRDIVRASPRTLGQIATDRRCSVARRRASVLLAAMAARGMLMQTRTRGPWRWLSDEPTK